MSINNRLINTGAAGGVPATRAYGVSPDNRKLSVYDISDPSNMSNLGEIQMPNSGPAYAVAVDVENQFAYCTQDNYLYKINVSNPSSMSIVSTLNSANLNQAYEVAFNEINGNIYVVGAVYNCVATIYGSTFTAQYSFGFSEPWGITLYPEVGYGYTSNRGDRNIRVINQPASTKAGIVTSLFDADFSSIKRIDIDKETNTLYTMNQAVQSISSVNISNPTSPSKISTVGGTGTTPYNICVDSVNKVVYTAGRAGIRSFDVSNPSSMSLLGSNTFGGSFAYGVRVDPANQVLYVQSQSLLYAIDISNPSNLGTTISTIATPSDEYLRII